MIKNLYRLAIVETMSCIAYVGVLRKTDRRLPCHERHRISKQAKLVVKAYFCHLFRLPSPIEWK